jgi:rRNA maturation endonuclease Nob1
MYLKIGWLSDDPSILSYLNEGSIQFILNCAERISKENPDMLFFNLCHKCGKLARTPQAKQCKFCGHNWH